MTVSAIPPARDAFRQAEQDGLKLAIRGRLVALILVGLWLGLSRPFPMNLYLVAAVATFGFIGLAHYTVIGTRYDYPWVKYVVVALDSVLLTFVIVAGTLSHPSDFPAIFAFRFSQFYYFFLIVASAAFSYSPGLVLWAGITSCASWMSAFFWVVLGIEQPITWNDIPPAAGLDVFLTYFFHVDFIARGSRIQESIILLIVAGLLAVVVHRARALVHRQAAVEREREMITQTFGKYVPEAVADALIADRGMLAPIHRTATILFADLERFTSIAESMPPVDVVAMLNAYFDVVSEVINRHGGVINQFQGDAILATFNVPLEDPAHASKAVRAALEIQAVVSGRVFQGVTLKPRIGINTGELVAGSVGGSGRQNYTVHGDSVNLAARLEDMNKEFDSRILLSEWTVLAAGPEFRFVEVGITHVRGKSDAVKLFTIST